MDLRNIDAAAAGFSEKRLARIGEHLDQSYVQPQKIAGCLTAVLRGGQLAYLQGAGDRDRERQLPITDDTLFRIYSMTKPVVSIALMTLWERGLFTLDDPVHRFIPQWKDLRVREGGAWPEFQTRQAERPMRIRDLLTHQSGLTYDFMQTTEIDRAYRKLKLAWPSKGYTLDDMIEQLATLPLEFSPGERWNYSVATDVLGYLIERISGHSLPDYLRAVIFEPLGMRDTTFSPREDQLPRFASCYVRDARKRVVLQDDAQASRYVDRSFFSGGGGLLSTVEDYLRFCQMLLGGGTANGETIIGRKTLDLMVANHLPGGADLASVAMAGFTETDHEGVGFGLGFASKIDPVKNGYPATRGSYYWGGMASTLFWVDPAEDLAVVFMTQLIPSSTFNFRGQLEALVYAALD
ncbi:serine hydrolase domain-containing protein [Congregibacter litoralis]|uniref:Beta-lactamase class C and other penicillin binding protein n=1 Tax=Congregibacter litoralis KT71 TaxID=314285 RepID=A4ACX4_9GAMM|nr:serine hydrolase domain-containing protein [Congregibacter litoralis]EAQ96165.2 Beta-lactamase class C and other penicillin binding protein [Congregibacter litoralis KT71]